jgi:hypothetical protein
LLVYRLVPVAAGVLAILLRLPALGAGLYSDDLALGLAATLLPPQLAAAILV